MSSSSMQEIVKSIRLNETRQVTQFLKNTNDTPMYLMEYVFYYLQGDGEKMVKIFLKHGNLNLGPIVRERSIKTLLHDAVYFTNFNVVKLLVDEMVKRKIDIDTLSYDPTNTPRGSNQITPNKTPLMIAVETGQKDVIKYLLMCGADPDQECGNGETPKSVAMQSDELKSIFSFDTKTRTISRPSFFKLDESKI